MASAAGLLAASHGLLGLGSLLFPVSPLLGGAAMVAGLAAALAAGVELRLAAGPRGPGPLLLGGLSMVYTGLLVAAFAASTGLRPGLLVAGAFLGLGAVGVAAGYGLLYMLHRGCPGEAPAGGLAVAGSMSYLLLAAAALGRPVLGPVKALVDAAAAASAALLSARCYRDRPGGPPVTQK